MVGLYCTTPQELEEQICREIISGCKINRVSISVYILHFEKDLKEPIVLTIHELKHQIPHTTDPW